MNYHNLKQMQRLGGSFTSVSWKIEEDTLTMFADDERFTVDVGEHMWQDLEEMIEAYHSSNSDKRYVILVDGSPWLTSYGTIHSAKDVYGGVQEILADDLTDEHSRVEVFALRYGWSVQ